MVSRALAKLRSATIFWDFARRSQRARKGTNFLRPLRCFAYLVFKTPCPQSILTQNPQNKHSVLRVENTASVLPAARTKPFYRRKRRSLSFVLPLLQSGSNDHPMDQLRKAGVDLSKRETIQAVIDQMGELVT